MAEIYAAQKRTKEAQEQWRKALRFLGDMQDGRLPENFWPGLSETIEHAGPALRPEIDKVLRTYIRRNGQYRFDSLLPAIWKSTSSAADAARWVAELSSAAAEPAQFLAAIVNEEIVGPDERELLYARLLELAQQDAERRAGDARNDARWRFQDYQLRYLRSLLANRQFDKAGEAIRAIPEDLQASMHGSLIPIQIEVAAAKGELASILERQDVSARSVEASSRLAQAIGQCGFGASASPSALHSRTGQQ